jgi:hypothetical protein
MKNLALLCAFVLLALPAAAAEDLTGKWSGGFTGIGPDGNPMTENVYVNLIHKGADLTGTAGPSADRQWNIENGKADGDKIAFDVHGGGDSQGGPVLHFSLAYADGHLKGDVKAQHGEMTLSGKVDITRVK